MAIDKVFSKERGVKTKYVIGKRTRSYAYNGEDTVVTPPYPAIDQPETRYHELRSKIYDTHVDAQKACDEAVKYNPVGFKVLKIVPRLSSTELQMRRLINQLAFLLGEAVITLERHEEYHAFISNLRFHDILEEAKKQIMLKNSDSTERG